jgi:hypothetical protein
MRKSIIERLAFLLLVVGFACLGCDSVKNSIDEMQGKGADDTKEKERLAAEKQAAEAKAKVEQEHHKVGPPIAADVGKTPVVTEEPVKEAGLIEKDLHWSDEDVYEQAKKLGSRYLLEHFRRGDGLWTSPQARLIHDANSNIYNVTATAHSLRSVNNNWTWACDFRVIFVSRGGKAYLNQVAIDNKVVYSDVDGKISSKFVGSNKSGKGAASKPDKEERKASADANRPVTAASILKAAKELQSQGKAEKAQEFLRRVVDRYPETPSADEARTLLGDAAPPKPDTATAAVDTDPIEPLSDERTWTDKSGKHTIKASLLSHENGKVKLKRSDGKIFSFDVNKLSEEDQTYLQLNFGG